MQRWNPTAKIVDCIKYYEASDSRPTVYDRISAEVLSSCSPYADTGLAVYGHPMFLVSAVEKTIAAARQAMIPTHIIPGISSFDTILCDLQIDLGYAVTLVDASLLLSALFHLPSPRARPSRVPRGSLRRQLRGSRAEGETRRAGAHRFIRRARGSRCCAPRLEPGTRQCSGLARCHDRRGLVDRIVRGELGLGIGGQGAAGEKEQQE